MMTVAQSAPRASGERKPFTTRRPLPKPLPVPSAARRSTAKSHPTPSLVVNQTYVWEDPGTRLNLARAFARSAIFNLRTILLHTLRDTEQQPLAEYQGLNLLSLMSDVGHANSHAALVRVLDQGLVPAREVLREHAAQLLLEQTQGLLPPRVVEVWIQAAREVVTSEIASRLAGLGLDPSQGFLHSGPLSLALDLALPLHPALADGMMFQLLRSNQIETSDFTLQGSICILSEPGRDKLLAVMAARWQTNGSAGKSFNQLLSEQLLSLVQHLNGENDVFTGCLLS